MLEAFAHGDLELRAGRKGGRRLRGRFPSKKRAVLSDGGKTGRPQKEEFGPKAFAFRVEDPKEDIHLLVGHSYDQPLASKATGTLTFEDTPEALSFEAEITPDIIETTWAQNAMAAIAAGLMVGLSPGFRIPPRRAVPASDAEQITQGPVDPARGMHGAIIRTILQALLYELSIVTRPAYTDAQVEARNWTPAPSGLIVPAHHSARWRA